ncbi:MAG TPA: alpha/beta fold hydrolase [Burkholderiales bacterium]
MSNTLKAVAMAVMATFVMWQAAARAGEIEQRRTVILSDGVSLSAHLFHPPSAADKPFPAIIMSHGWGGTAAGLEAQATAFARAGYFVIAFDYRGWGESDARLILSGPAPDAGPMREVREVIDPIEQATDIFNVIHWAMGEPMVDKARLGLWGTSFSGGLVAYVAARDSRVRALVSQVGYFGQSNADTPPPELARAYGDATRRARGELPYPAPGAREIGNLRGAPLREKFLLYAPIEDVRLAKNCAMLFIAAEREELFDNRRHPQLAYERAAGPKKYVMIPGIAHYGIYGEARDEAIRLAVEWFDRHLKN